jgi:competence protein ComEA
MSNIQKLISIFLFLLLIIGILINILVKPEQKTVLKITDDEISGKISVLKNKIEAIKVRDNKKKFTDGISKLENELENVITNYINENYQIAFDKLNKLDKEILNLNNEIENYYKQAVQKQREWEKAEKKKPLVKVKVKEKEKEKEKEKIAITKQKEAKYEPAKEIEYEPLTRITEPEVIVSQADKVESLMENIPDSESKAEKAETTLSIDINNATKEELKQLSGIGEVKATSIIQYREAHNGFKNVDEIIEVSGIGHKILEKIKPYIYTGKYSKSGIEKTVTKSEAKEVVPPKTDKININTATIEELKTLPRIGPKLAEAIVNYRDKNGPFKSIDELDNVPRIGPKTLEAIKPYIYVE